MRAHHLEVLVKNRHLYAHEIADNYRIGASTLDTGSDLYDHTYYVDVYGTTKEERQKFETEMFGYIQAFWDLPPDQPVQIATKRKDGICNSCIIGAHCDDDLTARSDAENIQGGVTTNDRLFVANFELTASKLGLTESYTKTLEPTERSTGTVESIVVTTDAQTVKEVITSKYFNKYRWTGFEEAYVHDPELRQLRKDRIEAEKAEEKQNLKNEKDRFKAEQRANFDNETEYKRTMFLYRVSKIRPIIGVIFAASGLGTIFNAGQTYEDMAVSPLVKKRYEAVFEDRGMDNVIDTGTDALAFLISGVMYSAWPRRTRVEDRLNGKIRSAKPPTSDSE